MVGIGATNLYIDVPTLPREEFELYSTQLFDDWESHVRSVLELPDYSVALELEEGSVKAVGRIAVTLGFLYIGIGQYGSFVSGVKAIYDQARAVGDYLGERAGKQFESSPKITKRGESLGRLQNLFVKVQRREITVEQAMLESEAIFGDEIDTVPEFVVDLRDSLENAPLFPEQTEFQLVDTDGELMQPDIGKVKKTRLPKPRQPAPDPDQYRVEIWRENRRGIRNVRVIKLD